LAVLACPAWPHVLIEALLDAGVDDLKVALTNCGVDDGGLGLLLRDHRITRMTSSYVGENKKFARQFLTGLRTRRTVNWAVTHELHEASGSFVASHW
jgi:3-oxoacid CoA-transferase subunit A